MSKIYFKIIYRVESKEWLSKYRWNKLGHELIAVEMENGYMEIYSLHYSTFMYARKKSIKQNILKIRAKNHTGNKTGKKDKTMET